jgi:dihydroxyacetone kinase-like predicted kinase
MALELGELDDVKIDNMLEEFRAQQEMLRAAADAEMKEFGMVAVALGDGLVDIFSNLLVDCVVDGGQTMNPSIDDLVKAIDDAKSRQVFVLPNNTNIILAAQQAAELTDTIVHVIPTKSVPMGIAAALAFNPDLNAEINAEAMRQAAEQVHTASITYAVRDTVFDGRDIREGDIMGLLDNHICILGTDVNRVSEDVLEKMINEDTVLISIYYGCDVDEEMANSLRNKLAEIYELCDVAIYSGGQPLYYYLIAVE